MNSKLGEKEYRWLEKGLRGLGFFAHLDLDHLAGVLPYISLVSCPKGKAICREGAKGDSFYLIYDGSVQVTKKGWDKPVAKLKGGDFFGEMSLLFAQPRTATVSAATPAKFFVLHSKDFNRMLGRNPGVARTIRKIAEARRKELAQS